VNQGHRYNRLRILWYWTDRFFELVASYRHRGCDNAAVARDWSTKSEFGLSYNGLEDICTQTGAAASFGG
jgi:hypothetical protein